MDITAVFSKMIYLFAIIIIGFVATKVNYLNTDVKKSISRLATYVTGPVQVLSSVLKPNNHPISNKEALFLTGIAFVFYMVMIVIAKFLVLPLRGDKMQNGCYRFMLIFSNMGAIGYPVIDAVFGEEYRFYATIFLLMFNIFCWSYGLAILSGEKFEISINNFKKPVIVAVLIAYVLYFTKIGMRCPEVGYNVANSIGETNSVVCMILTGIALAELTFKDVFGRWQLWALCIVKMFVLPLIMWYILHLFIDNKLLLGLLTIISAMPIATNATVISCQFGGDEKLAASGAFLSTIVAVATIPVLCMIIF